MSEELKDLLFRFNVNWWIGACSGQPVLYQCGPRNYQLNAAIWLERECPTS